MVPVMTDSSATILKKVSGPGHGWNSNQTLIRMLTAPRSPSITEEDREAIISLAAPERSNHAIVKFSNPTEVIPGATNITEAAISEVLPSTQSQVGLALSPACLPLAA